jgi:hypothetical protein
VVFLGGFFGFFGGFFWVGFLLLTLPLGVRHRAARDGARQLSAAAAERKEQWSERRRWRGVQQRRQFLRLSGESAGAVGTRLRAAARQTHQRGQLSHLHEAALSGRAGASGSLSILRALFRDQIFVTEVHRSGSILGILAS